MRSLQGIRKLASRILPLAVSAFAFVGCNNYTSQPLCTDDNAVIPSGVTGVYTLSIQDEDFNAQTQEIRVGVSATGRLTQTAADGAEDEGRVCQVGAHTVIESYNEDVQGYEQQRFYVTNMGLTYLPIFYDRAGLEAAGIRSKIFEMPATARSILGNVAAGVIETAATRVATLFADDAVLGLKINNARVSAEKLSSFSHAAPLGLTLLRQ